MKDLSFNSPYARAGMFFAVAALLVSNLYDFEIGPPMGPLRAYDVADVRGARAVHFPDLPLFDESYEDFEDFVRHRADVPNFREAGEDYFSYGSETPCFRVEIDPEVAGHDSDYRLDMFGGRSVVTAEQFRADLEVAMAESFTEEVWARDRKCFNGSFVVSFDVDEGGRLGNNMLVHHLRGSSSEAGIAVLDVLRSMDAEGHVWHDGHQPAGEVRVPVSFRLE